VATRIKSTPALIRGREFGTCLDAFGRYAATTSLRSVTLDQASRARSAGAPSMARDNAEFFSVAL